MKLILLLQVVCAAQFLLAVFIIMKSDDTHIQTERSVLQNLLAVKDSQLKEIESKKLAMEAAVYQMSCLQNISHVKPRGTVLLLLITRDVTYYNLMSFRINNILQNIPSDWVIQIFYKNTAAFQRGLSLNPGWKRHFIQNKRICSLEIPRKRELTDQRETHYRLQPWIWMFLVAELVLVADGMHATIVKLLTSTQFLCASILYIYAGIYG